MCEQIPPGVHILPVDNLAHMVLARVADSGQSLVQYTPGIKRASKEQATRKPPWIYPPGSVNGLPSVGYPIGHE